MSVFRRLREQAAGRQPKQDQADETLPGKEAPPAVAALPPAPPVGAISAGPLARAPAIAPLPGPDAPTTKDPSMSLMPKPATPSAPSPGLMPPRPGLPGQPGAAPAGQMPRPAAPPVAGERRTMVIGKGISLAGTVTDAERIVIEGTMESQMLQAAELSISSSGTFKGEVQVQDAEIAGIFDGTLTARGALVIRGSGRIIGVARCGRLQVEDGGQISGRMEMLGDGAPAPAPVASPAPAMPRPVAADLTQD